MADPEFLKLVKRVDDLWDEAERRSGHIMDLSDVAPLLQYSRGLQTLAAREE